MKKRLLAVAMGAMLASTLSGCTLGSFCYLAADKQGQCQVVNVPNPPTQQLTITRPGGRS